MQTTKTYIVSLEHAYYYLLNQIKISNKGEIYEQQAAFEIFHTLVNLFLTSDCQYEDILKDTLSLLHNYGYPQSNHRDFCDILLSMVMNALTEQIPELKNVLLIKQFNLINRYDLRITL